MPGRARPTRAELVVAAGFVLAAAAEAVVLHRGSPGLLLFTLAGAPVLAVLALRRARPVLTIGVITAFVVLGTTVQDAFWADSGNGGGVWLFALMFAAYSLGAHGSGRRVVLGGVLPLMAGLAIDLPTMQGWALTNGVVFLTAFVGVLPTAVGRVVRVRRKRLAALAEQRDQIVREQHAQLEAAALTERLRATERLQPALLDGLRQLADQADGGADPGELERSAQRLLGRTRQEVVALAAPVAVPDAAEPPPVDYLRPLRSAAQRWTVLGAGVIGAALALESTGELPLSAPAWVAVAASLAVCLPMALMWWRPLGAMAVAWCAVVVFSRTVAPLDGALSETAFTLAAAFAVAALCRRRVAVAGLAVCLAGQLVGVGTQDPFGVAVIITVCWLGGLTVNEVGRLVEQSRANNRLLVGEQALTRQRAVVEERLRLAGELHDQVGHSLTVVALQAGAARRLAATDPARAQALLPVIAAAARDGLAAMTGQTAPGSSAVVALLERTRAAGLTLTADVEASQALDPQTAATVYRVLQEALTNVLRHAPGAEAAASVRREGADVRVVVRNAVAARPGDAAGTRRGLLGLQEQVAGHGGELRWGRCADGGFEVSALLRARRLEQVNG